ncbi:hypothetical protein EVAR_18398_1 [Eumeta japonica]|uniref:Uncharacterized protein n=1 Tax=Eumeta variegata TaxID=151549 RepID=A0A4C1UU01_EUMVA|nr:hypothetical protein EVAR_18398_1 [Eumeta japonica]
MTPKRRPRSVSSSALKSKAGRRPNPAALTRIGIEGKTMITIQNVLYSQKPSQSTSLILHLHPPTAGPRRLHSLPHHNEVNNPKAFH